MKDSGDWERSTHARASDLTITHDSMLEYIKPMCLTVTRFLPYVGQISPKWDKYGPFLVHLGALRQNVCAKMYGNLI